MSLSFSVSGGFVRPFLSILGGACKLGDFLFLVPSEDCLEVISVHPSSTSHLTVTIDALHLEGYRYRRPPHHPLRPATISDAVAGATPTQEGGEGNSYVSGSGERPSASAPLDVLASATTQGQESGPVVETHNHDDSEHQHRRGGGAHPDVGNSEGLALRVPAAALQSTLLRQSATSIQTVRVGYTAADPFTDAIFGRDTTLAGGVATTTTTVDGSPQRPEMLRLDCMLSSGVVKSYQLHLVNGDPPRVIPLPLEAFHLDLRTGARLLGSLLGYLPASSATCTMAAMDGRFQLSWSHEVGAVDGSYGGGSRADGSMGMAGGRGGAAFRATRRRGRGSDGLTGGEHSGNNTNNATAVVSALQSHFTTFQYFDAPVLQDDVGDAEVEDAGGGIKAAPAAATRSGGAGGQWQGSGKKSGGPVFVTATDFCMLPRKVVDVKSLKLVAWLASQLDQQLQLVMGAVGTPIMIRTGAAADSFVVGHPRSIGNDSNRPKTAAGAMPTSRPHPQQQGCMRGSTVVMGGGDVPQMAPLSGSDTLPGVSVIMCVAATDEEPASTDASTASASAVRATPRVSNGQEESRGGGALAPPPPSLSPWGSSTGPRTSQQQQQQQQQLQSNTNVSSAHGSLGADALFTFSQEAPLAPPSVQENEDSDENGRTPFDAAARRQDPQQQRFATPSEDFPLSDTATLALGSAGAGGNGNSGGVGVSVGDASEGKGKSDSSLGAFLAPPTPTGMEGNSPNTYEGHLASMTPRNAVGGVSHVDSSDMEGTPQPQQHGYPLFTTSLGEQVLADATPHATARAILTSASTPAHSTPQGLSPLTVSGSVPDGAATCVSSRVSGGNVSGSRRSSLFPLDYASFANHAMNIQPGLRLSGTSMASDGVAATLRLTGGGSLGANGEVSVPPAVAGSVAPTAENDDPEMESDYPDGDREEEGYDEVDAELQQFLDSCTAMMLHGGQQPQDDSEA